MGKGDKKSRKGKISMGSYGVRRPRKKAKTAGTSNKSASAKRAAAPKKAVAAKKAAPKKAAKKAE